MAKPKSALLPIFLIVLVDVLGFTIVIPLLAFYAEEFGATPLIATLLVSVYAVCSLISTPIIGRLSDQYGRKPLLMISQFGTCAGFVMLALSNSLWMVFVGRILDGFTAGNLSIAQAYISDHTAPENRAKAFGVIGIAFGIGFMFGPGLGGWLGDAYGHHMPFVVAACLSAISIICTATLLSSEKPPQDAAQGDPSLPRPANRGSETPYNDGPRGRRPSAFDWRVYAEFFGRPALRAIYVQFFMFSFAFSLFFSGFALFAKHNPQFQWGSDEVGYLFTYSGFLGIIMQGGLLGRMVKKYGEFKMTILGFVASTISYALVGFSETVMMLIVASTVSAFGHGVLRPVLTARLTQAVGRHEQGVVLGISGSLGSVAMALAPPTGGAMLDDAHLLAWALIPAVVSVIGLLFTVLWSGVEARPAGTVPDAGLHSDA